MPLRGGSRWARGNAGELPPGVVRVGPARPVRAEALALKKGNPGKPGFLGVESGEGSGGALAPPHHGADQGQTRQQHAVGFRLRNNSDLKQLPANLAARKSKRAGRVNVDVGKA